MKSIDFLGIKKFIKYRDIRNLDMPWGWKDPRNTFTIDVWREIFPDAKVLHIYRNPVDVAESLRVREVAKNAAILKNGLRLKGFKLKKREYRVKRRVGYQEAFMFTDIHENIKLWEEYTKKALSLDRVLGKNIMHIRYETLLENFSEQFMPILEFIGFQKDKSDVKALIGHVRSDRKFAFTRDKDLVAVYHEIKNTDLMRTLGYHAVC
jgi:hypothetical protein